MLKFPALPKFVASLPNRLPIRRAPKSKFHGFVAEVSLRGREAVLLPRAAMVASAQLLGKVRADIPALVKGNHKQIIAKQIVHNGLRAVCIILCVVALPVIRMVSPYLLNRLNAGLKFLPESRLNRTVNVLKHTTPKQRLIAATAFVSLNAVFYFYLRSRAAADCRNPVGDRYGACGLFSTQEDCQSNGGVWNSKIDFCRPQRVLVEDQADCRSRDGVPSGWDCDYEAGRRLKAAENCLTQTNEYVYPSCSYFHTQDDCTENNGVWEDRYGWCTSQHAFAERQTYCQTSGGIARGWDCDYETSRRLTAAANCRADTGDWVYPSCTYFDTPKDCAENGGVWRDSINACRSQHAFAEQQTSCKTNGGIARGWDCDYETPRQQRLASEAAATQEAAILQNIKMVTELRQAGEDCRSPIKQQSATTCVYFTNAQQCGSHGGEWYRNECRPHRELVQRQAGCENDGGMPKGWDCDYEAPKILKAAKDCRSTTPQNKWPYCSYFETPSDCNNHGGVWNNERCWSQRDESKLKALCADTGDSFYGLWKCDVKTTVIPTVATPPPKDQPLENKPLPPKEQPARPSSPISSTSKPLENPLPSYGAVSAVQSVENLLASYSIALLDFAKRPFSPDSLAFAFLDDAKQLYVRQPAFMSILTVCSLGVSVALDVGFTRRNIAISRAFLRTLGRPLIVTSRAVGRLVNFIFYAPVPLPPVRPNPQYRLAAQPAQPVRLPAVAQLPVPVVAPPVQPEPAALPVEYYYTLPEGLRGRVQWLVDNVAACDRFEWLVEIVWITKHLRGYAQQGGISVERIDQFLRTTAHLAEYRQNGNIAAIQAALRPLIGAATVFPEYANQEAEARAAANASSAISLQPLFGGLENYVYHLSEEVDDRLTRLRENFAQLDRQELVFELAAIASLIRNYSGQQHVVHNAIDQIPTLAHYADLLQSDRPLNEADITVLLNAARAAIPEEVGPRLDLGEVDLQADAGVVGPRLDPGEVDPQADAGVVGPQLDLQLDADAVPRE